MPPLQQSAVALLMACPECDLLMRRPTLQSNQAAVCPCCGYELHVQRQQVVNRSLALVIAALLLYVPANFLPIIQLNLLGRLTQDTLWSAVLSLYDSGMHGVALVVLLCSMVVPLLKLLLQFCVLLSIVSGQMRRQALYLYRIYHHLREWGMLEVYLLGILVAMVKLTDIAALGLGVGLFCFVALLLTQLWLETVMSPQQIWQLLSEPHDARD